MFLDYNPDKSVCYTFLHPHYCRLNDCIVVNTNAKNQPNPFSWLFHIRIGHLLHQDPISESVNDHSKMSHTGNDPKNYYIYQIRACRIFKAPI